MSLLQIGSTALHFACYNGHTEVVKYLLSNGADRSVTDQVAIKIAKQDFYLSCLLIQL